MMKARLFSLVLMFLFMVPGTVSGQDSGVPLEVATVVNIVDGDTIDVRITTGQTISDFRVRYIGINTPETSQPCASSATQANAALVLGETVVMYRDTSETDRYGRLLRYVFVGSTFVNAALVEDGWAEAVEYPPDTTFAGYFEWLETAAQTADKGCHPTGVFDHTPTATATPATVAGMTVTAPGNINLRGGPGTNYPIAGTLSAGQTMRAEGRNGDWLYLGNGRWIAAWVVTVAGTVSSLPTIAAPVAPAGAAAPAQPAQPAQPAHPPAAPAGFTCNCSKVCGAMSCEEAYFQLLQCGCKARDGDGDGVPCESICPGG